MKSESINEIFKEELKDEERREKGVYILGGNENRINPGPYNNENKVNSDKIYVGPKGFVRSDGIPKDYNGKNARIDEIKELKEIIS